MTFTPPLPLDPLDAHFSGGLHPTCCQLELLEHTLHAPYASAYALCYEYVRLRAGESRAHYYVWNGTPNEFALNLQFSVRPGVPDAVFGWHSLEPSDSPVRLRTL